MVAAGDLDYSVDLCAGSVAEWVCWDGWIARDECLLGECPDLTVVVCQCQSVRVSECQWKE